MPWLLFLILKCLTYCFTCMFSFICINFILKSALLISGSKLFWQEYFNAVGCVWKVITNLLNERCLCCLCVPLLKTKIHSLKKKPNGRAVDYYTTISTGRACQSKAGWAGPVTTGGQSGAKVGTHSSPKLISMIITSSLNSSSAQHRLGLL